MSQRENSSNAPTILIIGTGAIGSFYGGNLARAGARVSVVARSDYHVIKERGLSIWSPKGDFQFAPEHVLRHAGDYPGSPDFILVATKVLPDQATEDLIRPAVGPDTCILLIQNGIEIEGPLVQAFPGNEILRSLAFIAVSRTAPGTIRHFDYGKLTIGRYPYGTSPKAAILGKLFESVGIPCIVTEDVVTACWQKLVWNAPFNPISVLAGGADTQTMLAHEETARLVLLVMQEVCDTAAAVGCPLPPSVAEQNIDGTRAMIPYKTSMLLDFEAGRPMEVEAILGNSVRAARRVGVPVPHMETLYALLQLLDRRNRSRENSQAEVGA
ncbi:MAG: 2-dehydropantoate 2-reductase [Syntrophobacteraceae bacterium]